MTNRIIGPSSLLWIFPFLISLLFFFPTSEISLPEDGSLYMSFAANIYSGRGFVEMDWITPIYRGRVLLPAIIAGAFGLFGYSVTSAFIATRLFFVACILMVYALCNQLYGKWVALVSTLFILSSVSLNVWFTYIHLDHILPVFMLLFAFTIYDAMKKQSLKVFLCAAIVICSGYLLKEVALLVLPIPILSILLISKFRTKRNIYGTLICLSSIIIFVLSYGMYLYFLGRNPGIVAGVDSAVTRSASSVDEVAFIVKCLQAIRNYYLYYLQTNFVVAPLMVCAWIFIFMRGILERRCEDLFFISIGISVSIIVPIVGISGIRERQSFIIFVLSYIALAIMLNGISQYLKNTVLESRQSRFSLAPWLPSIIMVLGILFFQLKLESVTEGKFEQFFDKFNSVSALKYGVNDIALQGWRGDDGIREVGTWMKSNLPYGTNVIVDPTWGKMLYFYSHGHIRVQPLEYGNSERSYLPYKDLKDRSNSSTPLFMWTSPFVNELGKSITLSALTEEHLLNQLTEKNSNYILVSRRIRFLSFYLLDNPNFEKVADWNDGELQIYRVHSAEKNVNEFGFFVEPAALSMLKSVNRPELWSAFLVNYLNWGETVSQEKLRHSSKLNIYSWGTTQNYIEMVMIPRPKSTVDALIAKYEKRLELNQNPWDLMTLGDLYGYQHNVLPSTQSYQQGFLAASDDMLVQATFLNIINNSESSSTTELLNNEIVSAFENQLSQTLTLNPESVYKLGTIYIKYGEIEDAIMLYQQAKQTWPYLAMPFLRLAEIYANQSRYSDMIDELEQARSLKARLSHDEYLRISELYTSTSNHSLIPNLFEDAKRHYAYDLWPYIELGNYYLKNE